MDLGVDKIVPAVVGIDLHRGHLDPAVATMPLEAKRAATLVDANRKFFSAARLAASRSCTSSPETKLRARRRTNAFPRSDRPTAYRVAPARDQPSLLTPLSQAALSSFTVSTCWHSLQ